MGAKVSVSYEDKDVLMCGSCACHFIVESVPGV